MILRKGGFNFFIVKIYPFLLLFLNGFLTAVSFGGINIYDDFNDGLINSEFWNTTQYNSLSNISENNSHIRITNRGYLSTKESYIAPYSISGKFKIITPGENFVTAIRSNLSTTNTFGELNGITFTFSSNQNHIQIYKREPNGIEGALTIYRTINSQELSNYGLSMTSGQDYYFMITDDGYNFSLSLNSVLLAEHSDNYSYGNLITFYSREYYGTHSTELDYINIIPEPSTYALILGAVALCFTIRRRK